MTNNTPPQRKRNRFLRGSAHLIFMLILFVLPELVMAIALPHRHGFVFYPGFYVKTLIYITAFYLNYYVIIEHTIGRPGQKRHIWIFLASNFVVLAIGLVLSYFFSRVCFPPPSRNRSMAEIDTWQQILKSASFLLRDGVMMILTIGLAVALRLSSMWQDFEQKQQQSLAEQRSTELANLKSQLNPHFLFNTLNTIYALVDICPDDAKNAVHRLSGLLRYMLYEDVRSVRFAQEINFIEDYISLMRLRISGHSVKVNIEQGAYADSPVPPLLFIPLVENAFKYGASATDSTPIEISITAADDTIVCTTRNSFVHTRPDSDRKDSGIGIANLRRRLVLIYGNAASLKTTVNGNIYSTELRIPIKTQN